MWKNQTQFWAFRWKGKGFPAGETGKMANKNHLKL